MPDAAEVLASKVILRSACSRMTHRLGAKSGRDKEPQFFLSTSDWDSLVPIMMMQATKAVEKILRGLNAHLLEAIEGTDAPHHSPAPRSTTRCHSPPRHTAPSTTAAATCHCPPHRPQCHCPVPLPRATAPCHCTVPLPCAIAPSATAPHHHP